MAVLDPANARDDGLLVRSAGWNLFVAGLRGVAAAVLLLAATSGAGGNVGRALFAAGSAVVATIALRTLWSGAYLRRDGVLVRGQFRSYRLAWDEIEDIVRPPRPGGFYLWLMLRGGGHVPVIGCFSFSSAQLERLAGTIRATRPR
jgi:hypothetical protein